MSQMRVLSLFQKKSYNFFSFHCQNKVKLTVNPRRNTLNILSYIKELKKYGKKSYVLQCPRDTEYHTVHTCFRIENNLNGV